jgi:hypothetical protein
MKYKKNSNIDFIPQPNIKSRISSKHLTVAETQSQTNFDNYQI